MGPVAIALISVVAVVAVCLGGFALVRGPLSNDAFAIQGSWVGDDATRAVVITEDQIDLAGQAVYSYELDAWSKHLSTTFGDLSGFAHYRFSRDKSQLAIMDVASPDVVGAFFADLAWAAQDVVCMVQGQEHSPLTGEGVVLTRAASQQQASGSASDSGSGSDSDPQSEKPVSSGSAS